ncbi:MAG: YbaB/EbfC family nucleoid-associated protein [Candidatus Berkelbacteria bacterium]|nr:MAG: YbaB/EbfC family nucleoid-associated protein [Candidatus Berkelbacteria bacterium]QQG51443.1 MAG: YbaB/EbfC family nucleoid-associated protein [Candidatus Berkelbacteria bacterium]
MALPSFGQMKDMYQLQKKAKDVQKQLKNLEIEARSTDGTVGVIVNGEMKIVEITIADEALDAGNKNQLESNLKDTIGQAMAKAQSESAARLQPILKDFNFPGM